MLTEREYEFLRELRSKEPAAIEQFTKSYKTEFISNTISKGFIEQTKRGIKVSPLGKHEMECFLTEYLI